MKKIDISTVKVTTGNILLVVPSKKGPVSPPLLFDSIEEGIKYIINF